MSRSRCSRLVVAIVAWLLIGCTTAPAIDVGPLTQELSEVKREVLKQDNCGGTVTLTSEIQRQLTVVYEVTAENGVEVNGDGQIGLFGTDVGLGAAVAAKIGVGYGKSNQIAKSVTLGAAPGTMMEHQISYGMVEEVGQATISFNGQTTTVPFRFPSDFSLTAGSKQLLCPDASTPTPIATFTPPAPTNTPTATFAATSTATATTVPPCPFERDSDFETVSALITAEADAVNREDMNTIMAIFAPEAIFTDQSKTPPQSWNGPIARYAQDLFLNTDLRETNHSAITLAGEGIAGEQAWLTSASSGYYRSGADWVRFDNLPGSDHWELHKDVNGCWRIVRFDFNASHVEFP